MRRYALYQVPILVYYVFIIFIITWSRLQSKHSQRGAEVNIAQSLLETEHDKKKLGTEPENWRPVLRRWRVGYRRSSHPPHCRRSRRSFSERSDTCTVRKRKESTRNIGDIMLMQQTRLIAPRTRFNEAAAGLSGRLRLQQQIHKIDKNRLLG